jgi:predicted GIY-YIG superfamily endonuclease
MTDYSKTVIYKIQHKDDDTLLYVGHTTNFTKRKNHHKKNSIEKTTPVYKMIRENGGWNCFTMIVIKEYSCDNKMEARIEEDEVMREMKASMNTLRAYTSPEEIKKYKKEYRDNNKEKMKEYRLSNKELISEKLKDYYQDNKESLCEYQKEYRQSNKEKIAEYKKQYNRANRELLNEKKTEYRQVNREKIKEKHSEPIECDCGCIIRKSDLARHKRTKKHLKYIEK